MELRDPTHLFEGDVSEPLRKAARVISVVFHPLIISAVVFTLLCMDAPDPVIASAVCIFFSTILPFLEIVIYVVHRGIDMDVPDRRDRSIPLAAGVISYVIGAAVLFTIDVPVIVRVLMVAYAVNTSAVLLISLRWKISIHAIGIVGPTMSLICAFGPAGIILISALPFIMWSRYVMRKHTPAQLVCGALLGLVLTTVIFLIML